MGGAGIVAAEQHHHTITDLIYLGITAAFFVIGGLYANGCETL
jgi:hypothetical protein